MIIQLIQNEEANLLFFTFGHKSLRTNAFLFGSTGDNLVSKDSFFYLIATTIIQSMKENVKNVPYDTISIEILKIGEEKYIFEVSFL